MAPRKKKETEQKSKKPQSNAYIAGGTIGNDGKPMDIGADIFERGLCLPSDNKMTVEEQDRIIEVVKACFA